MKLKFPIHYEVQRILSRPRLPQYNFKLEEGHEPFVKQGCRYTNCVFTKDRNRYPLSQLDAVLWHTNAADSSFPDQRSVARLPSGRRGGGGAEGFLVGPLLVPLIFSFYSIYFFIREFPCAESKKKNG